MITDLFIDFFLLLLGLIEALLPDFTEQISWLSTLAPQAAGLGAYVGLVDQVIPLQVLFPTMAALLIILPLLAVYKIINWLWRHIPIIAGFGPGSG